MFDRLSMKWLSREFDKEFQKEVKNWLIRNTNMSMKEAERFVNSAYTYKNPKPECPYCMKCENVYRAEKNRVHNKLTGFSDNYYLCLDCDPWSFWN